jgi:glucose/sorbosone dehydrogenase
MIPRFPARSFEHDRAARRCLLLAILVCVLFPATGRAATYSIAGFSDTAVVTTLSQPTAFAWTPDGRMLVLEKGGRVRIVVNGALQGASALDISASVDSGVEKGLLGICLDPGFVVNGYVYLYYTNTFPSIGTRRPAADSENRPPLRIRRMSSEAPDTLVHAPHSSAPAGNAVDSGACRPAHAGVKGRRVAPDGDLARGC